MGHVNFKAVFQFKFAGLLGYSNPLAIFLAILSVQFYPVIIGCLISACGFIKVISFDLSEKLSIIFSNDNNNHLSMRISALSIMDRMKI